MSHNVVFANPQAELKKLCQAFQAKRTADRPLVYCQTYDVVENARQSIHPHNYKPSICWVYLDRVKTWIDAIPQAGAGKLTRQLKEGKESFHTFPHYSTFLEHGAFAIDLDRERVRALSNFAAWTVFDSVEYIAENLSSAALSTRKKPNPY